MNNLAELLQLLQHKITAYRKASHQIHQIRTHLQPCLSSINHPSESLLQVIHNSMQKFKVEASETVISVANFCSTLLQKQSQAHQQQVLQLRTEIGRQYKLITLMRKELEDLMEMMNQRNTQEEPEIYQEESRINQENGEISRNEQENQQNQINENYRFNDQNTINGLEVIQEEETQRTLMSSVHSFNEEAKNSQKDDFIKIQEKSRYSSLQQSFNNQESQPHLQLQEKKRATINNEEDQWPSNCKFEGLLESAASQNTQTQVNQEFPSQWESMPVSVESMGRRQVPWQVGVSSCELKDITNDCEQQRQKKTKLFLQQFRKTFNKCLSANVSRKSSKSNQAKPPKDKNRTSSTLGNNAQKCSPGRQNDNQRLINEMLKDIDNNTKFFVGNRKSQVKYEGEKKDNLRFGHGVLYYSNGLCYQGNFKNNLRHGFGVLRFNQIQIYRGSWAADELSGQGKIRNFAVINKRKAQGNLSALSRWVSYCGSFKGNRFEGEGTLYLQGGQKFLGKFICGSACGEGSLFRKNGQVEMGVWRNNELVEQF